MYVKLVLVIAGFSLLPGCATKAALQQQDTSLVKKVISAEKNEIKNTEALADIEDLTEEKYLLADSIQQLSQEGIGCNTVELCISFIKQEILKNWSHQSSSDLMKTNIAFVIGDNYEFSEIKIVKSSGNALFDNSVITAVSTSSPFLELSELPKDELERIREVNLIFSPPVKKKKKKIVLDTLHVQRDLAY